jgi:hypothetical protein
MHVAGRWPSPLMASTCSKLTERAETDLGCEGTHSRDR